MEVNYAAALAYATGPYLVPVKPDGTDLNMLQCRAEVFSNVKHPLAVWNSEKADLLVQHSLALSCEDFRLFFGKTRSLRIFDLLFNLCTLSDRSICDEDRVYFTRFLAMTTKLLRLHHGENARVIMGKPIPLSVAVDSYDGEEPLLVDIFRRRDITKIIFFLEQYQNVKDYAATDFSGCDEDNDPRLSSNDRGVAEGIRLTQRFEEILETFPGLMASLKNQCEEEIANKRYFYALRFILQHEEHSAENRLLNDIIVYHVTQLTHIDDEEKRREGMLEQLEEAGYPSFEALPAEARPLHVPSVEASVNEDAPVRKPYYQCHIKDAVATGNPDLLEAVIEDGGDITYTTLRSHVPLEKQFGVQMYGSVFAPREPHYYPKGYTLLGHCARFSNPECLEVLLRHYSKRGIEINTPENILSVMRPGLRKENLAFLVQNGFNMKLRTFMGTASEIAGFYVVQAGWEIHRELFDMALEQEREYNALMRQKKA